MRKKNRAQWDTESTLLQIHGMITDDDDDDDDDDDGDDGDDGILYSISIKRGNNWETYAHMTNLSKGQLHQSERQSSSSFLRWPAFCIIIICIYTFEIDTACEIESLQSCMQWKPSSQRGHQTWPLTESLWVSLPLARSACAHGQRTSLPSLDLKTVAAVILQSEP